jgi:hypothetical protein
MSKIIQKNMFQTTTTFYRQLPLCHVVDWQVFRRLPAVRLYSHFLETNYRSAIVKNVRFTFYKKKKKQEMQLKSFLQYLETPVHVHNLQYFH